nr:MAG TPA: hypothetical protein [Caudoviricetes sp.]
MLPSPSFYSLILLRNSSLEMIPSMYVSSSFFSRVFFCSTNSLRRCSFRSSISSMSLSFSFVVMRFFFKAYTSLRCVHHREACEHLFL